MQWNSYGVLTHRAARQAHMAASVAGRTASHLLQRLDSFLPVKSRGSFIP